MFTPGLLSAVYGGTPMDYLDAPQGLVEELVDSIPAVLSYLAVYQSLGVAAGMGASGALENLQSTIRQASAKSEDRTPAEFEAMLMTLGAIEIPRKAEDA